MTEGLEKIAHSTLMTLAGKVALGGITAIAVMVLNTAWNMRDKINDDFSDLKRQVAVMSSNIIALSTDRYTATQATSDFRILQVQIDGLTRRQDAVERSAPTARAAVPPRAAVTR